MVCELAPAPAHVDTAQLEPPQQRRRIDERVGRSGCFRCERVDVDGDRGRNGVEIDVEEREVPRDVRREPGVARPDGARRFEPCDALGRTALHLHDVRYHVNCARVVGLKAQRFPGSALRASVIAVLFETERVHAEHVAVAGHVRVPMWQHLGDPVAQHLAVTEPKIQRVRDLQGEAVARVVDNDRAVPFERKLRVAVEPRARRSRMPPLALIGDGCELVEHAQRGGEGRVRRGTAAEHELRSL